MKLTPGIEPITGRYLNLEIDGNPYRVYFEQAGSGIPLLCLHTAGAHSSQFRHIMCDTAVTDNFQVTAFDMPWHGKSNPPVGWQHQEYRLTSDFYTAAIIAVSEALALERPVVMGCSMGGRVVIRLAREYPHLFRAVIGLEGTDQPSPWWDDSWLDSTEFARGDFCAALVSGLVAPQSPDEFRHETLWHYRQSGSGVFRGDMHFFRTDSHYSEPSRSLPNETQCPVYLLTGEYDYSCRPEFSEATAARIDGAQCTIMTEMGHFPMSENPAQFRPYLLQVLGQINH